VKVFLAILAMLALLAAVGVFGSAKSAVHEIEAFILGLIFVTAMGTAGIIESIDKLREANEPPKQ